MLSLLRCATTLMALSLPLSACIVGPTNPWDDGAPPEIQVKGTLSGAAAYPSVSGEAPRPPDGIKVSVRQAGSDEAFEITTSAADDGAFRFEVPPGNWTVRAEHPAFAAASLGPVRVSAGDDIPVDTLVLRLPNATSSLSGRVVAQGGLTAQGVEVSLLHDAALVGCGAVEAKTTTDANGAFVFDPVRPGRYVVVARTEGATLDMLAGEETLEIGNDEDATLPRDLVIEPGTSVVEIEADGVLPSSTTRATDLVVHTRALAGMDEIQLGADPTFDPSLGGTGWRPFQPETAFALPPLEGDWTVFVQLRAGCVTSPLYAARVLFDPNAPEIVSAQAGTTVIDPLVPERPLAVVGAGQAGVPLTFTVIDESGVAALRFSLLDGAVTSEQSVTVTPQPGQSVVRATADIPVEEGRYTLTVELVDVAGNVTPAAAAPVVDVLRDVSAPTTPLPTAAHLEVVGTTAVIWLEERECQDGTRAPVCEVNPHPDGLYRVRGGALLDFVPFAAPPFEVPLAGEESSVIEIVAVDAAGYTSPGAGRVDVERHVPTTVFTAPLNKELGGWKIPNAYWNSLDGFIDQPPGEPAAFYETPALFATSGTAFFSLRARHDAVGPHNSYLLAQPAEAPDVGTRWATSAYPEAIRKLSYACSDSTCYDTYSRGAGALGAGSGALTWLERIGFGSTSPQRPLRYVLHGDADGRYDIRGPETDMKTTYKLDREGEPAPGYFDWELCKTRGRARCSEDAFAWAPLNQPAPFATAFDGRRLVTAGATQTLQRITGADEGQVTVSGPHVVAAVLEPVDGFGVRAAPLIGGVGVRIGVPAGTVLYGVFYEYYDSYEIWELSGATPNVVAHVAKGGGEELILAPHGFSGAEAPIAVGVFIPPGVTAQVPRVSVEPAGPPYRVAGMIDRAVPANSEDEDLDAQGSSYVDDSGRTLDLAVFLTERDRAGLGGISGLSLMDLGQDLLPSATVPSVSDVSSDPELRAALADELHGQLSTTSLAPLTLATASDDSVDTVPLKGCAMVVRPKTDVQLRGVVVEGGGHLDDLGIRVWERGPATSIGRYEAAHVNPQDYGASAEYFESTSPVACYYAPPVVLESANASGTATVAGAVNDTLVFDKELPDALDTVTDAGVLAAYGDLAYANLDDPNDEGWPVSPGDRIVARLSGDPNLDIDMYLRWNARAGTTYNTYTTYSAGYSSDELIDIVAPDSAERVYITLKSFDAAAPWNLTVIKAEPKLQQIASYDVVPGDVVRTTVTLGAEGNPDLYVRFGQEPTLEEFDCEQASYYYDEVCEITATAAGKVYVAVLENDAPIAYDVSTDIVQPTVVEVGSYAVSPANLINVEITSDYAAVARVRFDDAGVWLPLACETVIGASSCGITVPGSATSAAIGVAALEQETPFEVTTTVTKVGCDRAQAGDPVYGNYLSGVLREGRHYLITVGDGIGYSSIHDWPEDGPAVRYGPLAPSNAYLDMLGVATQVSPVFIGGEGQLVEQLDASASTCRLELDVSPSAQVIRPVLGDTQAAAVQRVQRADGGVDTSVISAALSAREVRQQRAPAVVQALPPGHEVAALDFYGDDLVWLAHDEEHRRASVWRSFAGVYPPGAPCEVHRFPADERIAAADLDAGRLLVASQRSGRRTLTSYALMDGAACMALRPQSSLAIDVLPSALVVDGRDAFLWRDRSSTDGGALLYLSMRELTPLYSSGTEQVLGFDARGADTAFSLYDDISATGRLLLVSADASSGALRSTTTLAADGPRWHPRFAGEAVVSVRRSAPDGAGDERPEVVLRPLDDGAFASAGETTLAGAAAYFAGAEPYDPEDPAAWSEQVLLEGGADNVVVLGQDADGVRRLAIFRLNGAPSSWSGLAPEHEMRLEAQGPAPALERVSVATDLVVVTFKDGNRPLVLHRNSTDAVSTWDELGSGTLDEERVLGVYEDQLLLMKYPGNLYVERPPLFVELFLRDPSTALPLPGAPITALGRLPAETYLRPFAFVGPGVDGALSFYDESASVPVLWRLDDNGFAVRDDGGHRPLTEGMTGSGLAAAPRSSGDALYFLRRQEGGVSLMRYRSEP